MREQQDARRGPATSVLDSLSPDENLLAPDIYAALTATLASRAGFRAPIPGWASVFTARIGMPDIGLLAWPRWPIR
jgi:2-methylisocitrate lyase-like PEP mutase family enzyme